MQKISVPGFENQSLEVDAGSFWKAARLFVNGAPARSGPKRGQFALTRDDGREVVAFFRSKFPDSLPLLVVDGQNIELGRPLSVLELIFVGAPLLLIFVGGCIGGLLGGAACAVNSGIMRSEKTPVARFILCLVVALVAVFSWIFVVSILQQQLPAR